MFVFRVRKQLYKLHKIKSTTKNKMTNIKQLTPDLNHGEVYAELEWKDKNLDWKQ